MTGKFSNWSVIIGLATTLGALIGAYIASVLGFSPEINLGLGVGIVVGGTVVGFLARIVVKGPPPPIIRRPER